MSSRSDARNDVRKLKRAARNAGWPLRAYVRAALTRPERGPPSMMRLAGEARRWAARKGLVLR